MPLAERYPPHNRRADLRLFLSLIRAHVTRERLDPLLTAYGPVDWPYLVHLAERHRVSSILYFNVRNLRLTKPVPAAILSDLRDGFLAVVARNVISTRRFVAVVETLEGRAIPVVPFKGPVLSHRIYGDSTLRYSTDLDFLVPKEEAVRAWQALRDAGYLPEEERLTKDQFAAAASFTKAFNFYHNGCIGVDLHWHLNKHTRYPYDYAFCRERLTATTMAGREIPCLSVEDLVVYLSVHGASHVWDRLDIALSIADLIEGHPDLDWGLVEHLAAVMHCKRMLRLGLFLARDLFGTSLPVGIASRVDADPSLESLAGGIYSRMFRDNPKKDHFRKRLSEIPYHLKIQDEGVDRVRYLLLRVFLPTIKDWRDLPLSPRLAYLYFIFRPVALMVSLIREKGSQSSAPGKP